MHTLTHDDEIVYVDTHACKRGLYQGFLPLLSIVTANLMMQIATCIKMFTEEANAFFVHMRHKTVVRRVIA